jgi:phage FluMu gp28-like protein
MQDWTLPEGLLPEDVPGVLLAYQQRLLETVSANAVTVYEKSRRIGISWGAAALAALIAGSQRSAGGMTVYYMGYNLDMAREFIGYVGTWAEGFSLGASVVQEVVLQDPDGDIKAFRVEFASGFSVVALPSTPRALRGKQWLFILDEASFHDNLEELLKAAFALLIWGGKVVVISTHDGVENPFNELVESVRSGRKPYALLRTTFDDALADGLYKRICLVEGKPWTQAEEDAWRAGIYAFYGEGAAEELDVIPRRSGGAYFSGALVEARMVPVPVLRLACPQGYEERPDDLREKETLAWCEDHLAPLLAALPQSSPHAFGMDFARSGDLSVIWPVTIQQTLQRHTPFTVELRNVPFRQQEQILFYIGDRLPRLQAGALDARGNGSFLAEYALQRYGAGRIHRIMLTAQWYLDNFPRYKAALEDDTMSLPKDRDILEDHRAVKMEKGIPRVPEARTKGKTGQRHGDAAIAALLADFASRQEPGEIDYIPVGTRRDLSEPAGTWAGPGFDFNSGPTWSP